jgi:type I restriction enzyme S subunit
MTRKDSLLSLREHGVDRVPGDWTQSRIKYLGSYLNGYPFKPDEWGTVGRPILRIQDLGAGSLEPNRFDGEIDSRYLIRTGDILISWSASLGAYRWAGEEAWLNQHIFKVSLDTVRVRDDFFLWLAEWFINELEREAHGSTMQHLTADAFGGFPVLLPPQVVQARIAKFLDRETTRLDALLASKAQALDLLAEKKSALVSHAVIRGLDAAALLRDSGEAWLGKIPAHWETERARWLFSERDERSKTGDEELLSVSHLTGVTPRSEKDVNMFEAETTEGYKVCVPGDLVINTMWAWMGAMGTASTTGIVSPAYNVYQTGNRLDPAFVDALVRTPAFAQEVTRYSKGVWSSRLRLYPEGFFEVVFPVPPLREQHAIATHLAAETDRLNQLIVAIERTRALIKERRAALVAACVTGKLDTERAA